MVLSRVVYLKEGNFGEDILVKVQRGTNLIFKLSPALHGITTQFFTNYRSEESFSRSEYRLLPFHDNRFDEDTLVTIKVMQPGSFHFYFLVGDNSSERSGGGWFIVDPELHVQNSIITLDSISMITYMAKCLGSFKDWEGRLGVARETGFNFVHFTPIQALGRSGSGYSILNQLELNPSFGEGVSWDDIKGFLKKMKEEWGMLSVCDIVLNHTSNESPWLKNHPECAYNLQNSPHLVPAYLLDRLLLKISCEVANDEWSNRGVPSTLNSEDHLSNLRNLLHEQIRELRLEEFYLINSADCRLDSLVNGNNSKVVHTYQRFGSKVGGNTPKWKVDELNRETRSVIACHLAAAVDCVIAGISYERIQAGGPKFSKVTTSQPLTPRYFVEINGLSLQESMEAVWEVDPDESPYIMAHNGWVMNDDPLRNFADPESNVYLRRELIAWSDSIKFRYGTSKESSPYLWSFMKGYVQLVASVFDGIRLDNCHSTPIHVGEYLIDAARAVRPELLVVAELFTNSDRKDNVFVNHLGINVLIREVQPAWDSHEEGRLLFRFGGKPVGAFENTIPPPVADALLFDQTHDNPSALEKRCFNDVLPTAALVSFGAFAIGTNRGYDDIVPHHIHVVHESRFYTSFSSNPTGPGEVGLKHGMFGARKTLNRIHRMLGLKGFSETFVDQLDADVVSITRGNPITRETMVLVAYTAFSLPPKNFKRSPYSVRAIEVQGEISEVIFEGRLIRNSTPFERDETFLTGFPCDSEWREEFPVEESKFIEVLKGNRINRVEFVDFQPGDVVAFRVKPFPSTAIALQNISQLLNSEDLGAIIEKLNPVDLNYVLYRCKEEEGGVVYAVPSFGEFVYAGLQGIASVLDDVSFNNDLGHPICCNLRDGRWLMDYIVTRLMGRQETTALGSYAQKIFQNVGELPAYLNPTYFEQCFKRIYTRCVERALRLLGAERKGELGKLLSLSSLQFVGIAEGGALPAGGDEFSFEENGKKFISYSLSAGLPHFSTGYMRNWGRDTFISLPGLLLVTERYAEAKQHILSYASVLRHGLIPNLMNKGNCRYNCRDATWWWLYSIVKYLELVPDGFEILNENVRMASVGIGMRLQEVMHLSIQSHFKGIKFREENAGGQIDAHMKDEGFNIEIRVDQETGFIHGGNAFNCGTWMDKMGSSEAGGFPATPRDGAAVEIVGLCAAVLKKLSETKEYEHHYVENLTNEKIRYSDWYFLIKSSFESQFFVSATTCDPLVNVRNIYKDTVGASNGFGDFQLRPNFLVAMIVAPELFNTSNATLALDTAEMKLVSKLGIKTLDESDWNYNGDYYNMDSSDRKIAGGFNYHQGPEWVWPIGFYLRARLKYCGSEGVSETRRTLGRHFEHLRTSPWRSLPELTNRNGKICPASCPAQAWSCATLMEVLTDMEALEA